MSEAPELDSVEDSVQAHETSDAGESSRESGAQPPSRKGSKRALAGLMLEIAGCIAMLYLVFQLFQPSWIGVEVRHWVLLAVSALSLVGFLLCVSAMFQQDREVAVLGIWVGILGSIGSAVCATMMVASTLELWGAPTVAQQSEVTEQIINEVVSDIQDFIEKNNIVPTAEEAEDLLAGRTDGWGKPIRYQRRGDYSYEVSSDGPNQTIGDADDIRTSY